MSEQTMQEPRPSSPPTRTRSTPGRPAPKLVAEAAARIHAQTAKRRDAMARASRETLTLERLVAESVSAEPLSVTWYNHPGVLSREQAIDFGPCRNAAALHALMDRHRKRETGTPARRR